MTSYTQLFSSLKSKLLIDGYQYNRIREGESQSLEDIVYALPGLQSISYQANRWAYLVFQSSPRADIQRIFMIVKAIYMFKGNVPLAKMKKPLGHMYSKAFQSLMESFQPIQGILHLDSPFVLKVIVRGYQEFFRKELFKVKNNHLVNTHKPTPKSKEIAKH